MLQAIKQVEVLNKNDLISYSMRMPTGVIVNGDCQVSLLDHSCMDFLQTPKKPRIYSKAAVKQVRDSIKKARKLNQLDFKILADHGIDTSEMKELPTINQSDDYFQLSAPLSSAADFNL